MPRQPLLLLLMALVTASTALALPRYSAQYGQSCHLCHVNPAGGGLRTAYGSQFFAGSEMAEKVLGMEDMELLSPKLSERVDLGLDLRGMAWLQQQPEANGAPNRDGSSFFLMQGDLYLGLRISEKVQVVVEQSLRGEGESHALLQVLPWHGSVKVGRFLPNYGWRWADHNTAARQALGYAAGQADTGVEVELHPDHFSLSLAVTNDNSGLMDGDDGKALTARGLWQGQLAGMTLGLGLDGRISDRAPSASRSISGLFAGLSKGPFTWTGQLDRMEEAGHVGIALSHEAAWKLRRGLDLLFAHDFHDQDMNRASGAWTRQRLAMEWTPQPGLALQPALGIREDSAPGLDKARQLQAEIQIHIFM